MPVAVAMAAGIVLGRYANVAVGLWAVLGLACLVAAAATLRREHLRGLTVGCIAAGVLFGAATAAALAWWRIPDDHIANFSAQGRGGILAPAEDHVPAQGLLHPPCRRAVATGPWAGTRDRGRAGRRTRGRR
jgi:hypothetical protein